MRLIQRKLVLNGNPQTVGSVDESFKARWTKTDSLRPWSFAVIVLVLEVIKILGTKFIRRSDVAFLRGVCN